MPRLEMLRGRRFARKPSGPDDSDRQADLFGKVLRMSRKIVSKRIGKPNLRQRCELMDRLGNREACFTGTEYCRVGGSLLKSTVMDSKPMPEPRCEKLDGMEMRWRNWGKAVAFEKQFDERRSVRK